MKNESSCYRAVFAAAFALSFWAAPLTGAVGAEDNDLKVEAAGERAHFAEALCQAPPERVAAYKARLRKRLSDVNDFDQHWQRGWTHADRQIVDMNSLRVSNPEEFASRLKPNCERLNWMAENSLRVRQQK